MTIKDDIIVCAKTKVDTPYRDKGRDEFGVDCVGYIMVVARELGLSDYENLNYSKRPNGPELKRNLAKVENLCLLKNKWDWQTGDIGVFATGSHPVHMGFLERDERGNEFVLHAWAPARKVVRAEVSREILDTGNMKLKRVYRFKDE